MLDALVRTAEGPVVVRVRPNGPGRARVEVVDQSRFLPVRDEPDENTGAVVPTESGQVTELLDQSGRWGFRLHSNGSRTRWFTAGQDDSTPATSEPALRMTFERGQVRRGVSRARREVGQFLAHHTRLPQPKIDAALLALSELLGNAALHAKQGGAELTVEANDSRVRISITDTSLGLPKWRTESNVDAADEVAPSPTVNDADVDALLAGIVLAALESGRTNPNELGVRADGEHGRGARIVTQDSAAVGTDVTPHGKTVWVEYDTPPKSYTTSPEDIFDVSPGRAGRADGAAAVVSPWKKRGQSAEGPQVFRTPPGDVPGTGRPDADTTSRPAQPPGKPPMLRQVKPGNWTSPAPGSLRKNCIFSSGIGGGKRINQGCRGRALRNMSRCTTWKSGRCGDGWRGRGSSRVTQR